MIHTAIFRIRDTFQNLMRVIRWWSQPMHVAVICLSFVCVICALYYWWYVNGLLCVSNYKSAIDARVVGADRKSKHSTSTKRENMHAWMYVHSQKKKKKNLKQSCVIVSGVFALNSDFQSLMNSTSTWSVHSFSNSTKCTVILRAFKYKLL